MQRQYTDKNINNIQTIYKQYTKNETNNIKKNIQTSSVDMDTIQHANPDSNSDSNDLNPDSNDLTPDLNNDDFPTEIHTNGDHIWKNTLGQIHRNHKPAILKGNGAKQWMQRGRLHREEDEPAFIQSFDQGEIRIWAKQGQIHREHGKPAYI